MSGSLPRVFRISGPYKAISVISTILVTTAGAYFVVFDHSRVDKKRAGLKAPPSC